MASEELIRAVVDRVSAAAPDATVILFGSHARGDARADSDIDLLVVEPVVESRHAEMVRLGRAVRDLLLATDIIVVSEAVYRDWADEPGTVIYEAAREGRVVYAPASTAAG